MCFSQTTVEMEMWMVLRRIGLCLSPRTVEEQKFEVTDSVIGVNQIASPHHLSSLKDENHRIVAETLRRHEMAVVEIPLWQPGPEVILLFENQTGGIKFVVGIGTTQPEHAIGFDANPVDHAPIKHPGSVSSRVGTERRTSPGVLADLSVLAMKFSFRRLPDVSSCDEMYVNIGFLDYYMDNGQRCRVRKNTWLRARWITRPGEGGPAGANHGIVEIDIRSGFRDD
jgi:hypothetical protein